VVGFEGDGFALAGIGNRLSGPHPIATSMAGSHVHAIQGVGDHTHALAAVGPHSHSLQPTGDHVHDLGGGDAETRPINQALGGFIRY
jgi:hypothetical protein